MYTRRVGMPGGIPPNQVSLAGGWYASYLQFCLVLCILSFLKTYVIIHIGKKQKIKLTNKFSKIFG